MKHFQYKIIYFFSKILSLLLALEKHFSLNKNKFARFAKKFSIFTF
jgi:hypothetical protein